MLEPGLNLANAFGVRHYTTIQALRGIEFPLYVLGLC